MSSQDDDYKYIENAYTDFAKIYINTIPEPHTCDDYIKWMEQFNPDFKTDKVFKSLAPSCYEIALCEKRLEKRRMELILLLFLRITLLIEIQINS